METGPPPTEICLGKHHDVQYMQIPLLLLDPTSRFSCSFGESSGSRISAMYCATCRTSDSTNGSSFANWSDSPTSESNVPTCTRSNITSHVLQQHEHCVNKFKLFPYNWSYNFYKVSSRSYLTVTMATLEQLTDVTNFVKYHFKHWNSYDNQYVIFIVH